MKKLFLAILFILSNNYVQAQYIPELIKDSLELVGGSNSTRAVVCNGKLFFLAWNDAKRNNVSLWTSNGTTAGTLRLTEYAGWGSIRPFDILVNGADLIFTGANDTGGSGLWKTDGTIPGTVQLKSASVNMATQWIHQLNNKCFFAVYNNIDKNQPIELWQTDGTPAGTSKYFDMPAQKEYDVYEDKKVGNLIYYVVSGGRNVNRGELWVTDGTSIGTQMVKRFDSACYPRINYNASTELNGKLYFAVTDYTGRTDLWVTDGSPTGTLNIKSINKSTGAIFSYDNSLYIGTIDSLLKSDGTASGTIPFAKLTLLQKPPLEIPTLLYHNELYFVAANDTAGFELFVTDGTQNNTHIVADIYPRGSNSSPYCMKEYNNELYFGAEDSYNRSNLYRTDGTTSGTRKLSFPGANAYSDAFGLIEYNSELYMWAKFYRSNFGLYKIGPATTGIRQQAIISIDATLSPNPAAKQTKLEYTLIKEGKCTIDICDVTGKSVYSAKAYQQHGKQQMLLPLANIAPGMYIVTIKQLECSQRLKLLVE